jgi:hypothetical protein
MTTIVQRDLVPQDYQEMLKTETHHNHPIVLVDGVLRWQADPFICELYEAIGLNEIVHQFYKNGLNKNSEVWRELYRKMGYSLNGYWEVFYWEVNNESAGEYKPPTTVPDKLETHLQTYQHVCSFRAEYLGDASDFIEKFFRALELYLNTNGVVVEYYIQLLRHKGERCPISEPLVEVRMDKPMLQIVENVLRSLDDSHVMLQTLRPIPWTENSFKRDHTKE